MNNLEIKKIRKELRLTQESFADKLKVSKSLVQKWESGERTPDDFIIKMIKNIYEKTQKEIQESTLREPEATYETTYDRNIAAAEERIKEFETKLKSNDPDLTTLAIKQIKTIIEGLYEEIALHQEAKNDYLKHNK